MAHGWEIKAIHIPVRITPDKVASTTWWVPGHLAADPTWKDAEKLASEGWELVSVVAVTHAHEFFHSFQGGSSGFGSSATGGYELVFKRPRP